MREPELLLLVLMVAVGGLSVLAGTIRVPYPILLVLGGLVLGFLPGVPPAELPPDLVLVLFLPPLLYQAAFFSSPRDLRADMRTITLLAVGLVLATMSAVAAVAHTLVGGLPWAAAFALGAIVAPTDPLAATAIARRLGVPRRLVTVLEGESLVNDATALVIAGAAGTAYSVVDQNVEALVGSLGGFHHVLDVGADPDAGSSEPGSALGRRGSSAHSVRPAGRNRRRTRSPVATPRSPRSPSPAGGYRRGRKNSRRSPISRSGASIAAKCPPRSNTDQWTMVFARSAKRRMVWKSFSNTATPVGTVFGRSR
jgi:hypothetical protein